MSINKSPIYNIKVVLNKTGIAADTLRAWERRYGLPNPQRTSGGHRLYSDHDIATIKWLMERQKEGLSISNAVDLWNEQTDSGTDPLAGAASLASTSLGITSDSTLASLRSDWVRACQQFDEATADQIINEAFSAFPIEAVCTDVIQKGLSEIGELWYENKVTVQQEHFASALAIRRLDALLSAAPPPSKKQTIIVGCPPEEWHTFTPLMLSLFLRRLGYKVIYLGANVPADRFAETVEKVKANLIVLVAQQLTTAATLQQASTILTHQQNVVAFGGRIFNQSEALRDRIPGHFLGQDLNEAVGRIEKILKTNPSIPDTKTAPKEHMAAHQVFTAKRSRIDASIKEMLQPLSISPEDINTGIHFLGDHITAALQLGDMSYVSAEIDWLKSLLKTHSDKPEQLVYFMQGYAEAVDKNINGQGQPIFDWLHAEMEKIRKS